MITANLTIFGRKYTPPPVYLLDTFGGASVAFSVFKVNTAYTGYCIRARRMNDSAEMDIGFVNGMLDTAALLSFTGANSARASIVYDQSGNGNNLIQPSVNFQFRIVNAGVLDTVNGKPAFWHDSMFMAFSAVTLNSAYSYFTVGKKNASGDVYCPVSGDEASPSAFNHFSDNKYYIRRSGGYFESTAADTNATQVRLDFFAQSGTQSLYKNDSSISGSFNALGVSNTLSKMGQFGTTSFYSKGYFQQFILYNSDQMSNRTGIQTMISAQL